MTQYLEQFIRWVFQPIAYTLLDDLEVNLGEPEFWRFYEMLMALDVMMLNIGIELEAKKPK